MKFTPTALTLPFLSVIVCWGGLPVEESGLSLVGCVGDETAHRLDPGEIEVLLESAKRQFESAPAERKFPPLPLDPFSDLHLDHPLVRVRCVHPRLLNGPVSLRQAVRANQREAFSRSEKEFCGYIRWLEEEGPAPAALDYSESWMLSILGEDLISLSCDGSWYGGGAHPNFFYRTKTLWRDQGEVQEVLLADLFRPSSGWLGVLSAIVLQQLRAAEASAVEVGAITFLDEEHLRNWRLTRTGIQFLFAPYEVGCFADGSFSAFVGYVDVRDLLDPAGPVAGFLR
jgi:hypothetical protein